MKQTQLMNGRIGIYYLLGLFSIGALMLFLLSPNAATANDLDLPPREDMPSSEAVQANGQGARVHLQAHFSQDWPWESMHWQDDLWLNVQWLDEHGVWQEVDGWHGTLDSIQQAEDWMGMKEIWLADVHLGTGPYRWTVTEMTNKRVLTVSDPFYLPSKGGDLLAVDMMLTP